VQKQKGHPATSTLTLLSRSSGSHNNISYLLAVTLPGPCALFGKNAGRRERGAQNKQHKQINETSSSSSKTE